MTVNQTLTRIATAALVAVLWVAPGRGQDYEKAQLRVYVPSDDAKLEIQGQLSKKTGAVRLFESPLLQPGKAYLYDLKITWTENGKILTRERTARVMAGQTTEIDMRIDDQPGAAKPPVKVGEPRPPAPMPPKPGNTNPAAPKTADPKPGDKPADPKPASKPADPKPAKPDVPFVATPELVVGEMLKLAKVKDGDVV